MHVSIVAESQTPSPRIDTMAYPTHNKYGADALWFRHKLDSVGLTSNGLAALTGVNNSVVSRKINGRQQITWEDAEAWAGPLRCAVGDILRAGNVVIKDPPPPPAIGRVDLTGELKTMFDTKPKVREQVSLEVPLPGMQMHALIPVLVKAEAPDGFQGALPGLVVLKDGRKLLRVVRAGAIVGKYDLLPAFGLGERENDVEIERVHWVAPSILV